MFPHLSFKTYLRILLTVNLYLHEKLRIYQYLKGHIMMDSTPIMESEMYWVIQIILISTSFILLISKYHKVHICLFFIWCTCTGTCTCIVSKTSELSKLHIQEAAACTEIHNDNAIFAIRQHTRFIVPILSASSLSSFWPSTSSENSSEFAMPTEKKWKKWLMKMTVKRLYITMIISKPTTVCWQDIEDEHTHFHTNRV